MKDKLPLIVGIGLPLVLVVFVLINSYLPSIYLKPRYNFIYANRNYDWDMMVVDGRLSYSPKYQYYSGTYSQNQPIIYLYDVIQNKSTQISPSAAQAYKLDPSNKSPDGFTVENSSSSYSYFPFFWESSDSGVYIKNKGLSKKLEIGQSYYDFQFVGWIVK